MSLNSSSSNKVARLADIFNQSKTSTGPGPGDDKDTTTSGLGNNSALKGSKNFKNSINIRRTSSQVARFSSAKKAFEQRDNDTKLGVTPENLNHSHNVTPVTTKKQESSSLANTLPHRLCSPGLRGSSKIPVGEYWRDREDRSGTKVKESDNEKFSFDDFTEDLIDGNDH